MNPIRHATRLLALGVALSCLIAPLVGQAQCEHRHFTVIDVPGVSDTVVTGLNNQGQVVGSYVSGNVTKSFVWSNGKFTDLRAPSSILIANANAINDQGQIVGLELTTDFSQGGFLYDKNKFSHFDNPNAIFGLTFPHSINNQGQVAGFFVDANSATSGFVYQRGVFKTVKVPVAGAVTTAINAINDDGQIAGYFVASQPDGSFATRAFLSVKGVFTPLSVPGAISYSIATGINNQGQVVGYYLAADFSTHGFLYERGHYTTFDVPVTGNLGTFPGGINDQGQISGEYVDSSSHIHGFLLSSNGNGDDDDGDCHNGGHDDGHGGGHDH